MHNAGTHRPISIWNQSEFNAVFLLRHLIRHSKQLEHRQTQTRNRIGDLLKRQGPAPMREIARRRNLSPEEFRREYLWKGVPVVLEQAAAEWPSSRTWGLEALKSKYGDRTLRIIFQRGLTDHMPLGTREYAETIQFGEFLDDVQASRSKKYLRFSPILEEFPELREDLDLDYLTSLPDHSFGMTFQAFVGGKGTYTPLHNASTPFFFVNVAGVKRWALLSNDYLPVVDPHPSGFSYNHSDADLVCPDNTRYPGLDCVPRESAVLEPGDILYLPSWYWHSVQNESPTVGVRCGFLYPRSMVGESPLLALVRILGAREPSLLESIYYQFFKQNLQERTTLLTTPAIYRVRRGSAKKPTR
jgi:hypothetical protein